MNDWLVQKVKSISISSIIQLVLSITTLFLSYNIGKEQSLISRLQYSPVFILSIEQLVRKDFSPTQTERFDINNEGYPVNNYDSDMNSVMDVSYYLNDKFYQKKFRVDYFSVQSRKSGGKGRMSGGLGEDNILMFSNLKRELKEKLIIKGARSISISFLHLTKVSYSDTEQIQREMYFLDSGVVSRKDYIKNFQGVDCSYLISLYAKNVDEIVSMSMVGDAMKSDEQVAKSFCYKT